MREDEEGGRLEHEGPECSQDLSILALVVGLFSHLNTGCVPRHVLQMCSRANEAHEQPLCSVFQLLPISDRFEG